MRDAIWNSARVAADASLASIPHALSAATATAATAASLLAVTAFPAKAEVATDLQSWAGMVVTGEISERVFFVSVFQVRHEADLSQTAQVIIVPAVVGYRLNDRFAISGGYNFADLPSAGTNEHRVFEQVDMALGKAGGWTFDSYLRLEQRKVSNSVQLGHRIRYRLRARHPLASADPGERPVALAVTLEPIAYLADADWGPRQGFDQLRTYVGLEVPLAQRVRVDGGYTNQFGPQPGPNEMNHALTLNMVLSL